MRTILLRSRVSLVPQTHDAVAACLGEIALEGTGVSESRELFAKHGDRPRWSTRHAPDFKLRDSNSLLSFAIRFATRARQLGRRRRCDPTLRVLRLDWNPVDTLSARGGGRLHDLHPC